MRGETRESWVGAASLVGLGLLLVLSYGSRPDGTANGYDVLAAFNRIDGLAVGDPVRMAGVEIGSVAAERLRTGSYRAELVLRIESDVRLPRDTSAAIHTDGLFGSKFVVLEPGGETVHLGHGDRIDFTQDSMVVEDLLDLIISEGKAKRGGV